MAWKHVEAELARPRRCGASAALAFWQEHAGRHLLQDLDTERRPCAACGAKEVDLVARPDRPPACAARHSLSRTYPKPGSSSVMRLGVGPSLAVVVHGATRILADGISLPGAGHGFEQESGRTVNDLLAATIGSPPQPPYLVVTFSKNPDIGDRLRLTLGTRRLFVSGARTLDVDLIRLKSAVASAAGIDVGDLVRAMSIDHARRRGALMAPRELEALDEFAASTPAAEPRRLPDKGSDTAAALRMVLRRLEAEAR